MVRPFMKGVEEDSVFIDLGTVKDRTLLDKALVKFNEEAEKTDMKQTRQYLGHRFLETLWLPNAEGRKTLIEDANIVRITIEKPSSSIEKKKWRSAFQNGEWYHSGGGYVTLNLTLSNVPDNECLDSHTPGYKCSGKRHLEPLKRVIIWDTQAKEDKQRQILLQ
ncbi:hypothetical protein PS6_011157 [Mucor atramentarius]